MEVEFFADIDWVSETHQVCVVDSDGGVLAERELRIPYLTG